MEFRPCIDIHNGKVKQIVGNSLNDNGDYAKENFVSKHDAAFYANFYKMRSLKGGHIILLNHKNSPFYEATKQQAIEALRAYPEGMQIGGGINADNAKEYLEAGASHVIITSYVFSDGKINFKNLEKLTAAVSKEKLVLDLSCRKKDGNYYIVTDRWQKYTDICLDLKALDYFSDYCTEFLIHAVDVEGKAEGIEEGLVEMLGEWGKMPITYAGGVHSIEELKRLKELGKERVHVTIGSALDLFGGNLSFEAVIKFI